MDDKAKIHFIGIGGTAMVAGARLAIEEGWQVRGSDNPLYPPTSEMVRELGVQVAEGYAAENLDWEPDLVVVGNVCSRGNPEVEALLERGMHYVSLPEWLKDNVLRARKPVVICGTHGKTTTTALTAFLLDQCGLEPGFLIGGSPMDFANSARLGEEGAPFVIEGDEYDTAFFDKRAKFFHYIPNIAVVTSIEFDHGDIYANVEEIERAFRLMLRQIPESGLLLVCADSPKALALKEHAFCEVQSYGFSENAQWQGEIGEACEDGATKLTVYNEGKVWRKFSVPMVGRHNMQNALAAVAVSATLGIEPDAVQAAMSKFRGIRRRMEIFLEAEGITFIDDFAHHPTAIRETIAAAKTRWPKQKLIVLFEPRSNTTITNKFQKELEHGLSAADEVCLGPIHRPERIPQEERLDREALANDLNKSGTTAHCAESTDDIIAHLRQNAQKGDIILILSNGAFGNIYQKLKSAFGTNT